jgi:hypothetical protein
MPNHCSNNLTVTGNKTKLKEFYETSKTKDEVLSFNKTIPIPDEIKDMASPVSIVSKKEYIKAKIKRRIEEKKGKKPLGGLPMTKKRHKELINKYGFDNWYDWSLANWGTKWDAYETYCEKSIKELFYTFDTAWSPPVNWLEKVSKKYPKLRFTLEYREGGAGFEGAAIAENGEISDDCRDIECDDDEAWE